MGNGSPTRPSVLNDDSNPTVEICIAKIFNKNTKFINNNYVIDNLKKL